MSASINLTEAAIYTAVVRALSTFGLTAADGLPVPIIQGQQNLVPEPKENDFVVFWSLSREPIETQTEITTDIQGIGSIAGTALTMTAVTIGPLAIGQTVYGATVPSGTTILAQTSGSPGGVGVYTLSAATTVVGGPLYFGTLGITQPKELLIQLDVHGPLSADNAERIATLFRSSYGVEAIQQQNPLLAALYTSGPRQIPFINAEQNYEERWIVDLHLQSNVTVTVTQQFADQLIATASAVESLAV